MTIISLLVLLVAVTIVLIGIMGRVALDDRASTVVLTRSRQAPGERELPPSDNEVGGRPL